MFFFLRLRQAPSSRFFPYTTLFRSPAQLATAYAALFNGGRLLVPQRARAEGFTPRVRATLDIAPAERALILAGDRKSTRLNSSHSQSSYAVFCLEKKKS